MSHFPCSFHLSLMIHPADSFETSEDGELTLEGFLHLQAAVVKEVAEDGDSLETWRILDAMGYNQRVELTKVRKGRHPHFYLLRVLHGCFPNTDSLMTHLHTQTHAHTGTHTNRHTHEQTYIVVHCNTSFGAQVSCLHNSNAGAMAELFPGYCVRLLCFFVFC